MLGERGVVDFDEQIYAAIETILADGPFRARLQRRCRHLLVDEFQDLTPAHVLLIRLLSLPGLDVFGSVTTTSASTGMPEPTLAS